MKRAILAAFALLLAALANANAVQVGEEVKDAGTRIDLAEGLRLQLSVEERNVVACFVDAKGKAVESPAESILLVVKQSGARNEEWRTVLKPGADARLTSQRILPPPYAFSAELIVRYKDGTSKRFPNANLELDRNPE